MVGLGLIELLNTLLEDLTSIKRLIPASIQKKFDELNGFISDICFSHPNLEYCIILYSGSLHSTRLLCLIFILYASELNIFVILV